MPQSTRGHTSQATTAATPTPSQAVVNRRLTFLLSLLALIVLTRGLFVRTYIVRMDSMRPLLADGDVVVVRKLGFGLRVFRNGGPLRWRDPAINDVVVFRSPVGGDAVKRVVGTSGDTLQMRSGLLSRNGVPAVEPYLASCVGADATHPSMAWQASYALESARDLIVSRHNWGPIVVPDGHFFVLGDNRDQSMDSRYWGLVAGADIIGSAVLVLSSPTLARPGGR